MLPEIWGETAWDFIHFVTMGYPDNPTDTDKYNYYQYFNLLQYVLPCEKCNHNLSNHLKKYPLTEKTLSNRTELVKWGIDLHNIVNYYTGKRMLTYDEAMNEINKKINSKKSNNWFYYFLLLVAVIIIAYLVYYYLYKKKKSR